MNTVQKTPLNLLNLTFDDLVKTLQQRYGCGKYHAVGLYREFYKCADLAVDTIKAFAKSPDLAEKIKRDLTTAVSPTIQHPDEDLIKFITRLVDGFEIETVIVPMGTRKTLCVSSQVGCRRGCVFCETGALGFFRNLSVDEIVGQVYQAKVVWDHDIRNIVFMGMGEPFDNLDNVIQAIRIVSDQRGLDIAKKHITVSTVGIPRGFHKLATLNWPTLKLAISLNAPNNRIRSQIMPVNHVFPMEKIKQALFAFPMHKRSTFFIEYVLIKGLNDSPDHARELAAFLKPLPVKINILPLNHGSNTTLIPPDKDDVQRFCDALIKESLFVRKRPEKGMKIMAACGQLGNNSLQKLNLRNAVS